MNNEFGYTKSENDYKVYKDSGRPVRVEINANSHIGYVFNIGQDFLELKPSLIYENFPSSNGDLKFNAKIENQLPKKINYNVIQLVEPLSEGYLERLVEEVNKVKPSSENKESEKKEEVKKWQ